MQICPVTVNTVVSLLCAFLCSSLSFHPMRLKILAGRCVLQPLSCVPPDPLYKMHFVSNQLLHLVLLAIPVHTLQQKQLYAALYTSGEQKRKKKKAAAKKILLNILLPQLEQLRFCFSHLPSSCFSLFMYFNFFTAPLPTFHPISPQRLCVILCVSVLLTIYLDPPLFSLL